METNNDKRNKTPALCFLIWCMDLGDWLQPNNAIVFVRVLFTMPFKKVNEK